MKDLDLNLLRVFDALMEQRSVTRAANHLGVTQPAVSHALARLRTVLDDPLFIRAPSGLQPTARAEEMSGGIRNGLQQFQGALARRVFDPATAERHFTIAAGSYFWTLLMPTLIERVRRKAPGISFRLAAVSEMLVSLLDQGAVDLAFGAKFEIPARLVLEPIYHEKMVWIAAPGHPILHKRLTAEEIGKQARIMIVPSRPFEGIGDLDAARPAPFHQAGQADWETRIPVRGDVTVYEAQMAVALVARTDLIAQVPNKVAALAVSRGEIAVLDLEPSHGGYDLVMIWHTKQRSDPGLAWLRDQIRDIVLEESEVHER